MSFSWWETGSSLAQADGQVCLVEFLLGSLCMTRHLARTSGFMDWQNRRRRMPSLQISFGAVELSGDQETLGLLTSSPWDTL